MKHWPKDAADYRFADRRARSTFDRFVLSSKKERLTDRVELIAITIQFLIAIMGVILMRFVCARRGEPLAAESFSEFISHLDSVAIGVGFACIHMVFWWASTLLLAKHFNVRDRSRLFVNGVFAAGLGSTLAISVMFLGLVS